MLLFRKSCLTPFLGDSMDTYRRVSYSNTRIFNTKSIKAELWAKKSPRYQRSSILRTKNLASHPRTLYVDSWGGKQLQITKNPASKPRRTKSSGSRFRQVLLRVCKTAVVAFMVGLYILWWFGCAKVPITGRRRLNWAPGKFSDSCDMKVLSDIFLDIT